MRFSRRSTSKLREQSISLFISDTSLPEGDVGETVKNIRMSKLGGNPFVVCLTMITNLSLFSGSRGMAGGQAIDLESVGKSLNIAELETMHIHKTGALIRTCIQLAALSAPQLSDGDFKALDSYAKCIGLSFQVQDDILDVTGDTATLGKTQVSDSARNKPTQNWGDTSDVTSVIRGPYRGKVRISFTFWTTLTAIFA